MTSLCQSSRTPAFRWSFEHCGSHQSLLSPAGSAGPESRSAALKAFDLEPSPHSGPKSRALRRFACCDQVERCIAPVRRISAQEVRLAGTGGARSPGDGSRAFDFPVVWRYCRGGNLQDKPRRRGTYNAHTRICQPIASQLWRTRRGDRQRQAIVGQGVLTTKPGEHRTAGTEGPASIRETKERGAPNGRPDRVFPGSCRCALRDGPETLRGTARGARPVRPSKDPHISSRGLRRQVPGARMRRSK